MKKNSFKPSLRKALALAVLSLQLSAAFGADCVAKSGDKRVALLELYTSEGCSSCPPADKWLSGLTSDKAVPENLLPLAFHVDYWNYIGWTDPFSQAKFSDRQRQHSRRRGASFVVTPQLLLDGQAYQRPQLFGDINAKTQAINRSAPNAEIRIRESRNATSIEAQVDARVADPSLRMAQLFIAVFENNLQTAVKSGENAGTLLKHDFVVRDLSEPVTVDANGNASHHVSIRLAPHWQPRDLRLAAFVQHPQSGNVLQALSTDCH